MLIELLLPLLLLTPPRLETEHFTLQFSPRDEKLAYHLSGEIEAIRARITSTIGHDPPGKTTISLVGPEQLAARENFPSGWIPPWAAAVAIPEADLILLKTRGQRAGQPFVPERILAHELTHIILGKATRNHPIPRWLNEGLAMYLAREWGFQHTFALFKASLTNRIPSLSQLHRYFSGSEEEIHLAYGLSFSFIAFLLDSFGRDSLHLWIEKIGRGEGWETAFSPSFLTTLPRAEGRWKKKIRFRYAWAPFIFSGSGIWFVLTFLFLLSYLARRRRSRQTLTRWRQEEGYIWEEKEPPPPPPTLH